MEPDRIGTRVAYLRKARGFTQRRLALEAAISLSLLTKVESGHAPASPAFVGAVARALRVDVPRLTGQPYDEPGRGGRLRETADEIRRTLLTMNYPDDDAPVRTVEDLAADVAHLSALGQKAAYLTMGQSVPTLLAELAAAIQNADDTARPRLYSLLAEAYSGASSIANVLGLPDLRDRVIDQIEVAAANCDDPLRSPRTVWQRTQSMMNAGAYQQALAVLERTRRELGSDPTAMTETERSVYGSLHLRSAVVAARAAGNSDDPLAATARRHLAAAREVADLTGYDRNDYGLAFGPSNVTQHEVSVAVELSDPDTALRESRSHQLPATVPAVRRGHHQIDLARAHLLADDPAGAFRCLQAARKIAPQQARHHPMVRETVADLAHRRRSTDELVSYASWLGIG